LVIVGSKLERIYPVARWIEVHCMSVVIGGAMLALFGFGMMMEHWELGGILAREPRKAGFAIIVFAALPSIVMNFLKKLFPLYRATDCPFCGFHGKQKLRFGGVGNQ